MKCQFHAEGKHDIKLTVAIVPWIKDGNFLDLRGNVELKCINCDLPFSFQSAVEAIIKQS